jgi:hypothetical protein
MHRRNSTPRVWRPERPLGTGAGSRCQCEVSHSGYRRLCRLVEFCEGIELPGSGARRLPVSRPPEEDHAFGRPSLTRRKLRALELKRRARLAPGTLFRPTRAQDQEGPTARARVRRADRDRLPQARRQLATHTAEKRCGRDTGAPIFKSSSWRRDSGAAGNPPEPGFSSSSPAPAATLAQRSKIVQTRDVIRP